MKKNQNWSKHFVGVQHKELETMQSIEGKHLSHMKNSEDKTTPQTSSVSEMSKDEENMSESGK